MYEVFWPSEKRSGPNFYFLSISLRWKSLYMLQQWWSWALMKLCVLWLGLLEGNPEFRTVISELWILWIQNSVLSSPFLNRYKSHLQIFFKELFLPIIFWSVFLYPDHLTSQMCFKQWPRCYRKWLEVKDEEEGERVEDGGTWHSQAGEQFTKCFSNLHAPLRPCLPCPWKVGRYQPRAGLRSSPRFFGFQSSILLYLTLSTADFCIFAGFSGQQVGNL